MHNDTPRCLVVKVSHLEMAMLPPEYPSDYHQLRWVAGEGSKLTNMILHPLYLIQV